MTTEEVNAIFLLLHINKDGKMNYAEVSLYKYHIISILTDPVASAIYSVQHLSSYVCPSL